MQPAHNAHDTVFARRIRNEILRLLEPNNTAHEHNISTILVLAQIVHRDAGRKQRSDRVDIDFQHRRLLVDIGVRVKNGLWVRHACDGSHDVDATVQGVGGAEQIQLRGIGGCVARDEVDAFLAEEGEDFLGGFVRDVTENNLRAIL